MNFKKGILQVCFANIVNLILSVCNGFLLPKYLSIETYAGLKTFLLYTSYVGILHFGYVDGIYIRYGGKEKEELYQGKFTCTCQTLVYFQILITVLGMAAAVWLQDMILFCAAASILPNIMVACYKMMYQAIGDFHQYRILLNMTSVLIFAANMLFIGIKIDNVYCYIAIQLAMTFLVFLFYEYKRKCNSIPVKMSLPVMKEELKENISLGFVIMLGNFMGIWITGMDRWFVKIFCSVADFAYYSFAVTMLKIINTVISAVSVTLYHYFCKEKDETRIRDLRRSILIAGAFIIASFYPLKAFISICLAEYREAIPIILLVYAAQYLMTVINAVYLNLYKALNIQKIYMKRMVTVTITAFLLNLLLGQTCGYTTIVFAVATFFTAAIWLWLCQNDMKSFQMTLGEWLYAGFVLLGYFTANILPFYLSLPLYITWIFAVSFCLLKKELRRLLRSMAGIFQK